MEKLKSEKTDKKFTQQRLFNLAAIVGVTVCIYSGGLAIFGERAVPTAYAQQDPFLSRRIDQMEQRFYSIENRLNRIEQDSMRTTITPRIINNNDTEIQFLRTQVDSLRLRLGETECGLLRIDERTLTPAARLARSKAGARESDKCRLDIGAPIQLSARP